MIKDRIAEYSSRPSDSHATGGSDGVLSADGKRILSGAYRVKKECAVIWQFMFSLLVYRAVSEEEISIQKGAELLRQSYADVASICSVGDGAWNV